MRRGGLTIRPADTIWSDWLDAAPLDPSATYDAAYFYHRDFDRWWAAMPSTLPISPADRNIIRSELFAIAYQLSESVRGKQSLGLMSFLGAALSFIGAGLMPEQRIFLTFLFMVLVGIACWSSNVYRRQRLLKQCLDRIMALVR